MGKESDESDEAAMEVEPHQPAAKRGKCSQAQDEQQNSALALTGQNGSESDSCCVRGRSWPRERFAPLKSHIY
jgi:hypothetical protein